jgi:hypothetical protein
MGSTWFFQTGKMQTARDHWKTILNNSGSLAWAVDKACDTNCTVSEKSKFF